MENLKRKLFLCDLDNTLIYSYKQEIGSHKVLVETMDERALSYMTGLSFRLLKEIESDFLLVPATTRSLAQYRRIWLFQDNVPEYALVSNGGHLMRKGEPDPAWYEESQAMAETAAGEFSQAEVILRKDPGLSFEIRMVDGLFLFTKSREPDATAERLTAVLDRSLVSVFTNGAKVYVLPKGLNKGRAVRRLRAAVGGGGGPAGEAAFGGKPVYIVAAGDSAFDLPMLAAADLALLPAALAADHEGKKMLAGHGNAVVIPAGKPFSDGLLAHLAGLL